MTAARRPPASAAGLRRRATSALAVVLLCIATAGCGLSHVSLVDSGKLTVTSPTTHGVSQLPVRVSWTTSYPTGSTYVVFLDREPIPPGKGLRAIPQSMHDSDCLTQPTCPDKAYLDQLNVFTTKKNELTLASLQFSADRDPIAVHRVTIVVLDKHGHRIDESAFTTTFRIPPNAAAA